MPSSRKDTVTVIKKVQQLKMFAQGLHGTGPWDYQAGIQGKGGCKYSSCHCSTISCQSFLEESFHKAFCAYWLLNCILQDHP